LLQTTIAHSLLTFRSLHQILVETLHEADVAVTEDMEATVATLLVTAVQVPTTQTVATLELVVIQELAELVVLLTATLTA
jgi:hypothetical protein